MKLFSLLSLLAVSFAAQTSTPTESLKSRAALQRFRSDLRQITREQLSEMMEYTSIYEDTLACFLDASDKPNFDKALTALALADEIMKPAIRQVLISTFDLDAFVVGLLEKNLAGTHGAFDFIELIRSDKIYAPEIYQLIGAVSSGGIHITYSGQEMVTIFKKFPKHIMDIILRHIDYDEEEYLEAVKRASKVKPAVEFVPRKKPSLYCGGFAGFQSERAGSIFSWGQAADEDSLIHLNISF